eukprot:scaffold512_cov305-Chaetoceros_neogracile.AAC.3
MSKTSSSSSARSATDRKTKNVKKTRTGENKVRSEPPIRFVVAKVKKTEDDDDKKKKEDDLVEIKVREDPSLPDSKTNILTLKFKPIETLLMNGPLIAQQFLRLKQEIFVPHGENATPKKVDKRFKHFKRLLIKEARSEFEEILTDARKDLVEVHGYTAKRHNQEVLEYSETEFYNWLKKDTEFKDSAKKNVVVVSEEDAEEKKTDSDSSSSEEGSEETSPSVEAEWYTGDQKCVDFEHLVMFKMHQSAWDSHQDVYEDHINYLMNDVVKPFTMDVKTMNQRFKELRKLTEYIPPPSKRDGSGLDANWERHGEEFTFDQIRKMQFNALPINFKKSLSMLEEDWKTLTNQKWMHYLLRFEKNDVEERSEQDAVRAKLKKEHDHKEPKGKVPSKKRETKRSFQGVARFCQMCKNAGMPEVKYTSHNTDKCSNKGKYETNLSGSQGRREEARKSYDKDHKRENRMLGKANKLLQAEVFKLKKRAKKDKQELHSRDRKKKSKKRKVSMQRYSALSDSSSSSPSSDSSVSSKGSTDTD